MMGDVRITGSVNGVGFAALIDLTAGHGSKGGPGLCVGLDFLGAALRKKQIQVEFDDMDDHAAIPEGGRPGLLDGLFRTLQPVFIGRHQ